MIAFYIFTTILVLLMGDFSLPPEKQVSARVVLFGIRQYKSRISPKLEGIVVCKFEPTCSEYAYYSIKCYGTFWGGMKAMDRLFRCSPWTDDRGYDPP